MLYRKNACAADKVIPIVRCGFCNCGPEGDRLLIASKLPGVYICDGCLTVALGTLVVHRPAQRRKLLLTVQGSAAKAKRGTNRRKKP